MKITDNNNSQYIGKYPIIIKFSTPSCGPCNQIKPIFTKLIEEGNDDALIAECDATENPVITDLYGIRSVPAILFFNQEGEIIDKHVGLITEDQMRQRILVNYQS
jgi:thioredoxin 1